MKKVISRIFLYLFLTLTSLIMVFPFIWMILGAFKTSSEIIQFPPTLFPSHFSFDNFRKAFSMAPFARYFFKKPIVSKPGIHNSAFYNIISDFAKPFMSGLFKYGNRLSNIAFRYITFASFTICKIRFVNAFFFRNTKVISPSCYSSAFSKQYLLLRCWL